ncbi:MAG: oligosaccharide flippase family protein [Bacteroidota bacterium]
MPSLVRLVKQTGVYTLGNVLLKAAGFALAFFTLDPAYLAQEAFGRLAMLETTAKVAIPLFGLGLSNGLLKFWGAPDAHAERGALSFTALLGGAVLGVLGALAVIALADPLARWLLDGTEHAMAVRLIGVYIGAKVLAATPAAYLRNQEWVWLHVLAIGVEMVLLVVGAYVGLVVMEAGLVGLLWAYVASAGISALVMAGGMAVHLPWRLRWGGLRRLAAFGVPLAAAGVGVILLNLGDRYLLKALADLETVAVYDWAGRLASVLYLLLVSSFSAAFSVLGVKNLEAGGGSAFHRRTFRHVVVGAGWASLALGLGAFDLTRFVSPNPAFLGVETLALPLAVGFALYGTYYVLVTILYAEGRTGTIARNILLATAVNVALNVALIPAMGAMGAAVATVLSYGGLLAITARTVSREVGTRFDWTLLVRALALVGALYLLGHLTLEWNLVPRLAARIALVGAYVPLIVALRVYSWEEVRGLLTRVGLGR